MYINSTPQGLILLLSLKTKVLQIFTQDFSWPLISPYPHQTDFASMSSTNVSTSVGVHLVSHSAVCRQCGRGPASGVNYAKLCGQWRPSDRTAGPQNRVGPATPYSLLTRLGLIIIFNTRTNIILEIHPAHYTHTNLLLLARAFIVNIRVRCWDSPDQTRPIKSQYFNA